MVNSSVNESARDRYARAYKAARSLAAAGSAFKITGLVGAWLIFTIGTDLSHHGSFAGLFTLWIIASLFGLVSFGLGAILGAQGRILEASLDVAVNTSPFLSIAERAGAMALEQSKPWNSLGLNEGSAGLNEGSALYPATTAPSAPDPQASFPLTAPGAMAPLISPVEALILGSPLDCAPDRRSASGSRRRESRMTRLTRRRWN